MRGASLLMISGEDKMAHVRRSERLRPRWMRCPVRAVLRQTETPVEVLWSP